MVEEMEVVEEVDIASSSKVYYGCGRYSHPVRRSRGLD